MKNSFTGKRLTSSNINNYLEELFPNSRKRAIKSKTLDLIPLLQEDYGEANDCTITSITTCICNLLDKAPEEVYSVVEHIAKKNGYNGTTNGTNPLKIKKIYDLSLKSFGSKLITKSGYGKCIGYSYDKICNLIDAKTPIILSVNNDGRNYYRNHSITIIGYTRYRLQLANGITRERRMLKVYDNWYKEYGFVDYEVLSTISSINHY